MIKLGIVMDPIATINIKKDTSFAMLLEAQRRGYELHYMEMNDLYLINGEARARTRTLSVEQNYDKWYDFTGEQDLPLADLDVILMRKIRRSIPNLFMPPTSWSGRKRKARLSSTSRRACATVTRSCSPPGSPN
jgi:hypothetical protein